MISYNEALSLLEKVGASQKIITETVPLDAALGRILAKPIFAKEAVPPFTNSAMDGFAVFSSDTFGASKDSPIEIPVVGLIAAGDIDSFKRACCEKAHTSVEIMTGAPLPTERFDSVIRMEDVIAKRDVEGRARSIRISRPSKPGDHIRLKGSDFAVGQTLLREGTRLSPEHILASASLGIEELTVTRRPRVSILCTGRELRELAQANTPLEPGMIRNSTGPFLLSALKNLGADARYLGVVSDDPELYRKTLEHALGDGVDIMISTGAVSVGKYDFVPQIFRDMGGLTHFHKVSIRPGKPIFFGELQPSSSVSLFFGLPGNPISTVVGLRFFVEPCFRAILGLKREQAIPARLSRETRKPPGYRCFFKGRTKICGSEIEVEVLKDQASYVVNTLIDANCWVVLPEEGDLVSAGAYVDIYPLTHAFEKGLFA